MVWLYNTHLQVQQAGDGAATETAGNSAETVRSQGEGWTGEVWLIGFKAICLYIYNLYPYIWSVGEGGEVWCGEVWCGVVLCGEEWCGVVGRKVV